MEKKGKVALIGAGPGDKGLLTIRGAELLSRADAVVYDRLVSPEILALAPEGVEKIDVGKESDHHNIEQSEINKILLNKALEGKFVARLKGGDPFVFGRGGEELEQLYENGVSFEAVPGVTSAIAALSYGGIPATHRDYSSSLHIITGHAKGGRGPDIDFKTLANLKGTIVFLMGVATLPYIVKGLLDAGMPENAPAAIIENGSKPVQRKLVSALGKIVFEAAAMNVRSPSVIAVGPVCALSDKFDWFSKKPLFGKKILVARAKASKGFLTEGLRKAGAWVEEFICMEISAKKNDLFFGKIQENLKNYDWIVFTTRNAADIFFKNLFQRGLDARSLAGIKTAAMGSAAASEIRKRGIICDLTPEINDWGHMTSALEEKVPDGSRALIVGGSSENKELEKLLKNKGRLADTAELYDTLFFKAGESLLKSGLSSFFGAAFTSEAGAKAFAASFSREDISRVKGFCIGPRTAAAAKTAGMEVYMSDRPDMDSLIKKIEELAAKGTDI